MNKLGIIDNFIIKHGNLVKSKSESTNERYIRSSSRTITHLEGTIIREYEELLVSIDVKPTSAYNKSNDKVDFIKRSVKKNRKKWSELWDKRHEKS